MEINWTDVMKRLPIDGQICMIIGGKQPGERESMCVARYQDAERGFVSFFKSKFFWGVIIKKFPKVKYLQQSRFFHVSLWAPIEEFIPYLEFTFSRVPGLLKNIQQERMSNIKYKSYTIGSDNSRRRIKNYYVGDDSAMYPQEIIDLDVDTHCQLCKCQLIKDGKDYWDDTGVGVCSMCISIVDEVADVGSSRDTKS